MTLGFLTCVVVVREKEARTEQMLPATTGLTPTLSLIIGSCYGGHWINLIQGYQKLVSQLSFNFIFSNFKEWGTGN